MKLAIEAAVRMTVEQDYKIRAIELVKSLFVKVELVAAK